MEPMAQAAGEVEAEGQPALRAAEQFGQDDVIALLDAAQVSHAVVDDGHREHGS